MATLEQASGAIARLGLELERRRPDLQDRTAEAVLDQAQGIAARRPSPQARMAASGLEVTRGAIVGLPSTRVRGTGGAAELGAIGWGSEMGSAIYRQFGPRSSAGKWLGPAIEAPDARADQAGDRWAGEAIDAALRGVR